MDNTETTTISLCSGYGGMELGIQRAIGGSLNVLAYSEIEAFAIENLVAKMEQGFLPQAPIWSNLQTFPAKEFSGLVDIITGGYPCQPFSHAGLRKGKDDPRHLWPHIKKIIGAVKPRWCFFENVGGHITMGLSTVISDLEEMGYRTTWGIFSASEVGAPHQRKRVFILGNSEHNGLYASKKPRGTTETVCDHKEGANATGESKGAGSAKELANTNEQGLQGDVQNANKEGREDARRSIARCREYSGKIKELGDSQHDGYSSRQVAREVGRSQKEGGLQKSKGASSRQKELADTVRKRFSTHPQDADKEGREDARRSIARCGEYSGKWPARPGEQQYEWEPPRTIKSKVGRTFDEYSDWMVQSTSRIDEIRLLGNGVCIPTVTKAWQTLIRRFDDEI